MKCKLCGCAFEMGYNGSVYGCDECAGVVRDENGDMSVPFNLINNELPDGVTLCQDEFGEYELMFHDDGVQYDDPIVEQAKRVIERYRLINWSDWFR